VKQLPERKEIDDLNETECAESHAEPHESPNVAEEVDQPVELSPLVSHEVERLVVDVQDGQVSGNVGVVCVLRILV
jgi:hypothetical protein